MSSVDAAARLEVRLWHRLYDDRTHSSSLPCLFPTVPLSGTSPRAGEGAAWRLVSWKRRVLRYGIPDLLLPV